MAKTLHQPQQSLTTHPRAPVVPYSTVTHPRIAPHRRDVPPVRSREPFRGWDCRWALLLVLLLDLALLPFHLPFAEKSAGGKLYFHINWCLERYVRDATVRPDKTPSMCLYCGVLFQHHAFQHHALHGLTPAAAVTPTY